MSGFSLKLRLAAAGLGVALLSGGCGLMEPKSEGDKLAGVWKLTAFDVEFQDTGERRPVYPNGATGYLVFMPEGRMMALITANGRKLPKTDDDRLAAFRTMFAYSGIYRLEGDKWITKVDTSWNEAWTGTDQVRFYKFDGPRLQVLSAWQPGASQPGRMVRGIIAWERER